MKFTYKNNFLFLFDLFFYKLFSNRILSYFAKPNFIVYDECFDNDLKKTKLNVKNKKIYTLSIFGFLIILGLLLFFISQSKKMNRP